MLKSELRAKYLQKRKKLPYETHKELSENIIQNFILQFKPTENQKVHCFSPIDKFREVDTKILMNHCFDNGIRFFVPKIVSGKLVSIEILPNTELRANSWGILEPIDNIGVDIKDFDFVITPLLYCDNQGNRVGYGKGFYDDFFLTLSTNAIKIGVSFFPPKEKISDIRHGDVLLDYLITPSLVFSFKTEL